MNTQTKAGLPYALTAFALAGATLFASSMAKAVEYNAIDAGQSKMGFTYTQMGVGMDGTFGKFNAQLSFNPEKPETARASMDVLLASIDAGSAEANNEVAGKQWFNAKQFPTAHFESTSVKALGGNKYQVVGKLTIKGKTQAVTTPVTFNTKGKQGSFEGVFSINRADFAVGEGPWADFGIVANPIQIRFKLLANAAS